MQDPIKEAREGNPKAIQELIAARLNNPNFKVRVSLRKGQLQVAIVSSRYIEPIIVMPVIRSVIDQIAITPGKLSRVKVISLNELDDSTTPDTTSTNILVNWSEEINLGNSSEETTLIQENSPDRLPKKLMLAIGSAAILICAGVFWWLQPTPDRLAKKYMALFKEGKGAQLRCTASSKSSGNLLSYQLTSQQKNNPLATAHKITNRRVASFASELNKLAVFVPTIRRQISPLAKRSIGYYMYTYEVQPEIESPLIVTIWKTADLKKFHKDILNLLKNAESKRQECQKSESSECKEVQEIYENLSFLSTSLDFSLSWQNNKITPAVIQVNSSFCVG